MILSIKKKILVFHLSVVYVVAVAMGITSYYLMVNQLQKVQKDRVEAVAAYASEMVEHSLDDKAWLFRKIAESEEFKKYGLRDQAPPLKRCFGRFEDEIPILSYVNSEGLEELKIVRGDFSDRLEDVSHTPGFRNAMKFPGQVIYSQVEYHQGLGEPALQLSLAVHSYFGDKFIGVCQGAIPLARVTDLIAGLKIGENGFVSMIDQEGRLLMPSQKDKILTPIREKDDQSKRVISDARSKHSGFMRVKLFGMDGLVAYAPVKTQGWSVLAVLPYRELMKAPNKMKTIAIGVFLIVFVAGGVIAVVYAGSITGPIQKLAETAEAIACGDFSRRVRIQSRDEIGKLAASFNMMADNLNGLLEQEKKFAHAEAKVAAEKKRADEFAELNRQLKANEQRLQAANQELLEKQAALEKSRADLVKADEELRESMMHLVQAEKLATIGEIAAGVGHEISHPLNLTRMTCQELVMDIKSGRFELEQAKCKLPEIVGYLDKIALIIDHMRLFSRRTAAKYDESVDMNEILTNMFIFLGHMMEAQKIELVKSFAPDLPKIKGNSIRLEQSFMNLVTNAIQALEMTEKEHKVIEIKTYAVSEKNAIAVEIKDNGVGIPEEFREKIFEMFFTTKDPGKGTGVGLAMVKKIVHEHGGTIDFVSKLNEGTTFRIVLLKGC